MYCPIMKVMPGNMFGHNDYRGHYHQGRYLTSAKCISNSARTLKITIGEFNTFYERYRHFKVFIDELVGMDKVMVDSVIKEKLNRVVDLRVPVEDKVKDLEVKIENKNVDKITKAGREIANLEIIEDIGKMSRETLTFLSQAQYELERKKRDLLIAKRRQVKSSMMKRPEQKDTSPKESNPLETNTAFRVMSNPQLQLLKVTAISEPTHKKSVSYINMNNLMTNYDKILEKRETTFH